MQNRNQRMLGVPWHNIDQSARERDEQWGKETLAGLVGSRSWPRQWFQRHGCSITVAWWPPWQNLDGFTCRRSWFHAKIRMQSLLSYPSVQPNFFLKCFPLPAYKPCQSVKQATYVGGHTTNTVYIPEPHSIGGQTLKSCRA